MTRASLPAAVIVPPLSVRCEDLGCGIGERCDRFAIRRSSFRSCVQGKFPSDHEPDESSEGTSGYEHWECEIEGVHRAGARHALKSCGVGGEWQGSVFFGGGAGSAWKGGAGGGAAGCAWRVVGAVGPSRCGGAAGGAGRLTRAGAGADPLRTDAGIAVYVLPRCGVPDGGGSHALAEDRPRRAAVRGCAFVKLRCVRRARPTAGVRRQRLRRDAARTVRVGSQAAGRELCGRRPRPGVPERAAPSGESGGDARLPRGDGGSRFDEDARSVVLARRRRGADRAVSRARRARSGER